MNEKETYNKLRTFLSIFGISYSYYIRECNGILYLNEDFSILEYIKSFERMKDTNEGYLYWRTLRFLWTNVLCRRSLKTFTLSINDSTYVSTVGNGNAVKDIDKTIELFNKLLDLGFKFRCQVTDNENYLKVIMHFKNNKNFSYYKRRLLYEQ